MRKRLAVKSITSPRFHDTGADTVFTVVNWFLLSTVLVIVLLPLMNIVSSSFSDPVAVGGGRVYLFPVGFTVEAYRMLVREQSLVRGFLNTLFYTVVGTSINVMITIMCAYPLSRIDLFGRKGLLFYFTFTMLFGGGMIPTYILIKQLGLVNTRWVMVLPGAMSVYYMIVARTFFITTIPRELNEAAAIDGASDFELVARVVLPLSTPILAVLTLFYAQAHWNAFFDAFLYLSKPELFNLQVVLRNFISNIRMMMLQLRR